jgi:hypothetical protein
MTALDQRARRRTLKDCTSESPPTNAEVREHGFTSPFRSNSKLLKRRKQLATKIPLIPLSLRSCFSLLLWTANCLIVFGLLYGLSRLHASTIHASSEIHRVLPLSSVETNHTHAIPNILIFTHRYNLLHEHHLENYNLSEEELLELTSLQNNIKHTIDLHPGATIRFLTDNDCIQSIIAAMGGTSSPASSLLVDFFRNEKTGMYKADLCRGAALWETGGLYLDTDVGVRLNLWNVLNTTTTFCTVRVHSQSKHRGAFFQAFMGASPQHAVIARYVQLFLEYYQGRLKKVVDGPVGVILLKRAYDQIVKEEGDQQKLTKSSGVASSLIRFSVTGTTEIWQEVLYLPELQHTLFKEIPPPVWGTRRACKFVVLSSPHLPVTVPLYSRIAGSRMCPAAAVATNDMGGGYSEEEEEENGDDTTTKEEEEQR